MFHLILIPLAAKYLRQVKRGDRILLYHTGKEKAIVGEMRVVSVTDGVVTVETSG